MPMGCRVGCQRSERKKFVRFRIGWLNYLGHYLTWSYLLDRWFKKILDLISNCVFCFSFSLPFFLSKCVILPWTQPWWTFPILSRPLTPGANWAVECFFFVSFRGFKWIRKIDLLPKSVRKRRIRPKRLRRIERKPQSGMDFAFPSPPGPHHLLHLLRQFNEPSVIVSHFDIVKPSHYSLLAVWRIGSLYG